MKIPNKVLENIQQNPSLQIEWTGHRDIYEVIEEWADSLFWLTNLWIAAYYLSYLISFTFQVQLGLFFLSIVCLIPALLETVIWSCEWHIITRDVQRGGGMYFKVHGVLGSKTIPIDIMKSLPSPDEYTNNLFYWFWKVTTNHRIQKVTIKSDANIFILNDKHMPPGFANAWFRVRGPVETTKPEDGIWHDIESLIRVMTRNLYPESKGKSIIEGKIDSHFYGN